MARRNVDTKRTGTRNNCLESRNNCLWEFSGIPTEHYKFVEQYLKSTPQKMNMETENDGFQKEKVKGISSSRRLFSGSTLNFGSGLKVFFKSFFFSTTPKKHQPWAVAHSPAWRSILICHTWVASASGVGHLWPNLTQGISMRVFPKIGVFTPQIIHFDRVFPYKPSILGKHPWLDSNQRPSPWDRYISIKRCQDVVVTGKYHTTCCAKKIIESKEYINMSKPTVCSPQKNRLYIINVRNNFSQKSLTLDFRPIKNSRTFVSCSHLSPEQKFHSTKPKLDA